MGTWSLQTLSVKNIDGRIVVYFYGMFNNGEHMQHMQVGRCHHCRCHHRRCATLISVKAFTKYPFFLWLSPFSHKPSIGTIMAGPPLVRKLRKAVYGRILNYNFDIIDTSTCSNECSGHGMWVGGGLEDLGTGKFRKLISFPFWLLFTRKYVFFPSFFFIRLTFFSQMCYQHSTLRMWSILDGKLLQISNWPTILQLRMV